MQIVLSTKTTTLMLILILSLSFLTGCGLLQKKHKQIQAIKEEPLTTYETRWAGALSKFMSQGDISAQANLSDLEQKHLYALGAYGQLDGEILVMDGKSFGTRVTGDELVIDETFDDTASLLVYDHVREWEPYEIAEKLSGEELEIAIKQIAEEHGIDVTQPFPFLLKGIADINFHVIKRDPTDTEHTHEKHKASGYQGNSLGKDVQVLGFYSESHAGVFTHHSTFLHMHLWNEQEQIGGHIDSITLGDMQLYLPK